MTDWTTPDLCDDHPDEVSVVSLAFADYGGRPRFSGTAVVVRCFDADGPDNTLVKLWCGRPGEGRVLVVDAGGLLSNAVLGDLIAADAVAHGWSGLLIHGAVRDVEILRTLDLGVRALGSTPLRSQRRGVGAEDVVLELPGASIRDGDQVYADATGIVVTGA